MNLKDFFATKENPPDLYWSLVIEPGWVQAGVWYIKDGVAEVLDTSPATAWEVDEELLGVVDAALSACVQKLPENFPEPQRTVFGVASSWVKGGEIEAQYLSKIKKICTELSLTPTGFVILPEAIAHLFKSKEGSPVSAVILGLGKESLEISVFKLGNLVGTTTVARSVSLVEDVVEGLSRFEDLSPIPSRIIIFNGRTGELDEAADTLSGANWEETIGLKFLHTPKVEILGIEKKIMATALAGASEIGKVSKVMESAESTAPKVEETTLSHIPSGEELGFVVDKDISAPVQKPKVIKPALPLLVLLGIGLIGIVLFWWFYPKAVISVYVAPKRFEEESNITFDSKGTSDPSSGIIPGRLAETTVSGEKTKPTTGTKLIGEKAKGTVSLRNGTPSVINFPSGTVLTSSGDLKFTLDKSASVSAAIDADNPGTVNADVTASNIGASHNLAKDEIFKVGNYPKADAYAKSASDFSGGTSREISAVSKDDQESLLEKLTEELSENAKKDLTIRASANQIFIDSLVMPIATNESFSHKIGDEADTLKLNLSMTAKAIIADKESLSSFVREEFKDKVPQGFVLRDSQIDYKFEFVEEDEGKFIFKVNMGVNFLPELVTSEIIKQIAGRTPKVVEEYLSGIPGFTRAEIKLKPRFPERFRTLPKVLKHITIEIIAER